VYPTCSLPLHSSKPVNEVSGPQARPLNLSRGNKSSSPDEGFHYQTTCISTTTVFWVMTACSVAQIYRRFAGICCILLPHYTESLLNVRNLHSQNAEPQISHFFRLMWNKVLYDKGELNPYDTRESGTDTPTFRRIYWRHLLCIWTTAVLSTASTVL
jgi:hypothetical protein